MIGSCSNPLKQIAVSLIRSPCLNIQLCKAHLLVTFCHIKDIRKRPHCSWFTLFSFSTNQCKYKYPRKQMYNQDMLNSHKDSFFPPRNHRGIICALSERKIKPKTGKHFMVRRIKYKDHLKAAAISQVSVYIILIFFLSPHVSQ